MFGEGRPIIYEAPADLKKWPSLKGHRLNGGSRPYLVFSGTLADCIRELLAKHVLSPGDAAEIATRQDFPKA